MAEWLEIDVGEQIRKCLLSVHERELSVHEEKKNQRRVYKGPQDPG